MVLQTVQTTSILWIFIIILLLIILWLLFRRPKPTPPEPEPPEPKPVTPEIEYYIRDQVVITGPPDRVARVRETVEDNLGIELHLRPRLEPPASEPEGDQNQLKSSQSAEDANDEVPGTERPAVNLYKIIRRNQEGQNITAVDVATAVNNLREPGVASDANYKTGKAIASVAGDPDTGEGYDVGDVGGETAEAQFYKQWALLGTTSGGMSLFKGVIPQIDQPAEVLKKRSVTATGKTKENERVVVAIFDTSPFDESETLPDKDVDPSPPTGFDRKVSVVQHNALPGIPDARDHGMYIASLVNIVAPECEIQLIRVLNDSNQGTLEILVESIEKFIDDRATVTNNSAKPLKNTVINLSLGVHIDPNEPHSDPPIPTLHDVLKKACDQGAVIVAASGNDSIKGEEPKRSQYPAAYDFVIDVGASNSQRQRACFSNEASLYAPGGDCQSTDSPTPINDQEWVIGYAYYTAPDSHFAYWRGTSFSAPLVSGLAALLLAEGHDSTQIKTLLVTNTLASSAADAVPVVNVLKLPLIKNP
jgi:hypothetical protein